MKRAIYIMLIILIFGAPPLLGAEIKIVKSIINTNKEKIYLKDIAQLRGCSSKWKHILLAHISSPGSSIQLPEGYIKARLKLKGVPIEKIKLVIPKIVKIKREATRITERDLMAIAKHCVEENNPWGKRLKIITIKAKNEILLPKGRLSYSCQLFTSPIGDFSIPIIFKVNGEIVSRTWVMVKTKLIAPIIVSAYPIRRGELITKDKIKVVKKDITRLPAGVFTNKSEVVGKRAKINIGINRVIYKNMVEIPPIIRRGQRVVIVAESDNLKVTAPGKAKENGRLGDIIKVENILSKKIITGKVVDSQTVKVKF